MQSLPPPTITVAAVYAACVDGLEDRDLKRRHTDVAATIIAAEASYTAAAKAARLFGLPPEKNVGGKIKKVEMAKLYTGRLAKKGSTVRHFYDDLLTASPNSICPLCAQRTVSTLDHYLPKAHFPSLAVTPANLVPACGDCNKLKLDMIPPTAGKQTLHPYFDDVDKDQWLIAEIIESVPPAAKFSVKVPDRWGATKSARVRHHFKSLKLGSLYASHAAGELMGIRSRMISILKAGGPKEVKKHLQGEAKSRTDASKNSWQAALYTALSANTWYCREGCKG